MLAKADLATANAQGTMLDVNTIKSYQNLGKNIIEKLNKGMENVCALGLESAGAHFFQSVIFCLEIFQKILREMDVHI